jgi:hypothetical protein
MELHVGMGRQELTNQGCFVGAEVVENDVNLSLRRLRGDDLT